MPTIRIPAGREHVAGGSGAWIEHELGRAAEEEATVNPSDASGLSSPAAVLNTLLLALVLGAGIAAIVAVRRRFRPTSSGWAGEAGEFSSVTGMARKTRTTGGAGLADDGGWENTLAEYKNLRDQGVLSEEEYRKIKTLVDPRMRTGVPELRLRHRPLTDPAGPSITRD